MKIANKISLSFLAVGLILASTAATIFHVISKNNLRESIYNNLNTAVSSRADHIETYLGMLETSVGQLSKSTVLENLLKTNGKEYLRQGEAFEQAMKRLKRTKEVNPSIYEFMLMDKTGRVAAASNESSVGSDKSTDALFLGARKGTYIKDVYYSEILKEPLMAVSAPVLDSQTGDFLGVLAAGVRSNELNNIVADKTGMGQTGEIYIVNKYGYMITTSRFREDVVFKQGVDNENVRQSRLHKGREHVLPQDKRVIVYPDYRGVQVIGAHEYIPRMQWAVLAEIDAKEAFAPLVKLRLVFLAILFIVPLAAWVLGIGIAGVITGSLHRLHKGIEIIGAGNLDYKVGTDARDEVGQLSRAFDQMTQDLKKTTTSIDSLNKEITERKKAEEALRIKDVAIASSINAIAISDLADNLTYVNDSFLKLWGYDNEQEVIGKSSSIFWEDPEQAKVVADALRQSGRWAGELNAKKKDGSSITVQLSSSIIVDSAGNAMGMMASFIDISERKRAEEALKEAQQSLKAIFDSANDGILIADCETKKFYTANNAICKMLGYTLEEIQNLAVMDIHPKEDLPWIIETFEKQSRGDLTIGADMPVRRKDNSIFYAAVNAGPMTIAKKRYIVGVFRDITERKKAEEEKRRMEERSRKVVEDIFRFIPEGVLVFSRKMELLRQNQAFRELVSGYAGRLGFTEDELENLIIDKIKTGLGDNKKEIRIARKHENGKQT